MCVCVCVCCLRRAILSEEGSSEEKKSSYMSSEGLPRAPWRCHCTVSELFDCAHSISHLHTPYFSSVVTYLSQYSVTLVLP